MKKLALSLLTIKQDNSTTVISNIGERNLAEQDIIHLK